MNIKGLTKQELNEIYDMIMDPNPTYTMNCKEDSFECGWKEAVDVFMLEIESKIREKSNREPVYNFTCPKCRGRMLVKDWRHRYTTNSKEPWCFCSLCRYKTYAEKDYD